jgi:hypothetical protein
MVTILLGYGELIILINLSARHNGLYYGKHEKFS